MCWCKGSYAEVVRCPRHETRRHVARATLAGGIAVHCEQPSWVRGVADLIVTGVSGVQDRRPTDLRTGARLGLRLQVRWRHGLRLCPIGVFAGNARCGGR